jgi:hypothetical protein
MMVDVVVVVVLVAFAVFRAWAFAARDVIFERPVGWVFRHTPAYIEKLVSCPWCLGAWLSFAAIAAVDAWWYPLTLPVACGLACSTVVGILGDLSADD